MTSVTALVLLGVGVGVLVIPDRGAARGLRSRADALRALARAAQEDAARASSRARALAERWSAAEVVARRGEY